MAEATAAGTDSRARPGSWWVLLLGLVLQVFIWSDAVAQSGLLAVGAQPRYDISRELWYLEDPSAALGFDDVAAPAMAPRFQPFSQNGSAYNFGFTSSALWFRIVLRADRDAPLLWYWKVALPTLDHVDLWVSRPEGGYSPFRAGDALPMSAHSVRHKDHVLQVPLVPGGDTTVYMRVQSTGAIALPVTLWEPRALHAHDHVDYALLSLYFGLVLGLFLYNLLLYFSIRDRAYLAYVVFVACMGISQALYTGLAGEFITRDSAHLNSVVLRYVAPLTLLMSVVFTRSFLASRRHMPQVDRVLRVLIYAWTIGIALLTLDALVIVWQIHHVLVLLTVPACAVAGVLAYRQKRPGARFFLLSWAVLLVTMVALALRNLNILPVNALTENPVLIGSAVEMVMLSFALADRINVTRREQRRAETLNRVRQAQKAAADQANAEKSRFLAAISHDLRQPMYALGLLVDGLRGAKLPASVSSALHDMKGSLTSINALLDSLLLMGRLEVGRLQPRMEAFYLDQVLERVGNTFEARAQEKGLTFSVTPTMSQLYSDPMLLERMVSNLVSNALRYTREGGVLVSVRPRSDHLLLQVWDTGRGIPLDKQEAIFGEFFRLRGDDSDGGVGIGLTIVRSCANLLGCTVSVRSTPGKGSCFSVRVPLRAPQTDVAPTPTPGTRNAAQVPHEGPSQGLRVVVVDDDAVVLRALTASLISRECDVTAATSWSALKERLVAADPPDIVICDYHVGRDTGPEMVERVRTLLGRAIPAIVVTGDTSVETATHVGAAGITLLHKPVEPQVLFAMAVQLAAQGEED